VSNNLPTPALAIDGAVDIVAAGRPMRLLGRDDTLLLELQRPADAWWLWRQQRRLNLPGAAALETVWRAGRLRLEVVCRGRTLAASRPGRLVVRPRWAGLLAILVDRLRGR
jgi:hypothetical protein